ncbi:MAG: helix-turn-helix transcriptional regulator [Candidatus Sumerlaeota bacterium]|nr:helix-turn-helix transcriptional regulator [Candidatus Sumerlaeota bacterium]
MQTFEKFLKECLKDDEFREIFEEERTILQLAMKLNSERRKAGLSKNKLAQRARLSPRLITRIESGANCRVTSYVKAGRAMGLNLELQPCKRRVSA